MTKNQVSISRMIKAVLDYLSKIAIATGMDPSSISARHLTS